MGQGRGQDDDRERAVTVVTEVIGRGSQLAVGEQGDHPPVAGLADRLGGDEWHTGRLAGEPGRGAGHLQDGVIGEESLNRLHVRLLKRGQVAVEDQPGTLVAGFGDLLYRPGVLLKPGSRALEQALEGWDRHVKHRGRLGTRLGENIAEQEGGPLAWRQNLRGGDQRETHALAGSGDLCRIAALVNNQFVWNRIKPRNLADRRDRWR